jgi:methyl-accepting chemotaxis protein
MQISLLLSNGLITGGKMGNLKIGVRLGIGFGALILLVFVMAIFSYTEFKNIKTQMNQITRSNTPKIEATFDISVATQNVVKAITLLVAIEDKDNRTKQLQAIEKERGSYRDALKKLEELENNDDGKALITKLKESIQTMAAANNKIIEFVSNGKQAEADKALSDSIPLMGLATKSADDIMEYQKKRIGVRTKLADSAYASALTGLAVITSISLLIGLTASILMSRSITRPIHDLKEIMRDIAEGEGDLTKNMNMTSRDELGELAKWFDDFMDKMQASMDVIKQTTHQVAAAAVQLHKTAEQIATGSEEVAAQAGTVATAGEEMSATSSDIAQNCSMAAEGSRQASAAAVSGAKVVDETIAVMGRIADRVKDTAKTVESLGERSEQIGEIVGTIQDIADQTNLLALNAAIEAARAGEQGRGFAVVADEVRALAERTTKATKEISEMIRVIQNETRNAVSAMEIGVGEVVTGSEKAAESGRALESILEQINEVTMQINQVATAAEEQTATTAEISSNMHQITEVVAQTSHGAYESATAANQLSGLAGDLSKIVNQFKV